MSFPVQGAVTGGSVRDLPPCASRERDIGTSDVRLVELAL